ncbi:hypothetical protein SAMN04488700_1020 [Carnobacterium iners]|uniref:Uncharacterized protein n=1 Tax=Carnobacterium iners TaxID=1073423 RepID=A0A1X7MVU8_9LACT|nr:hypothetical protein [Carnobacterium iners]SMH29000.1 hypothetical protein SAMN04488700_1020 [Carnobacterium iners]
MEQVERSHYKEKIDKNSTIKFEALDSRILSKVIKVIKRNRESIKKIEKLMKNCIPTLEEQNQMYLKGANNRNLIKKSR